MSCRSPTPARPPNDAPVAPSLRGQTSVKSDGQCAAGPPRPQGRPTTLPSPRACAVKPWGRIGWSNRVNLLRVTWMARHAETVKPWSNHGRMNFDHALAQCLSVSRTQPLEEGREIDTERDIYIERGRESKDTTPGGREGDRYREVESENEREKESK